MERNKKNKITIIMLAILLGVSVLLLGGKFLYNKMTHSTTATVTVPDNLITPDKDIRADSSATQEPGSSGMQTPDNPGTQTPGSSGMQTPDNPGTQTPDSSGMQTPDNPGTQTPDGSFPTTIPTHIMTAETKKAAIIRLYNKQPENNTPFKFGNMFPGDRETKYFCVQVSYHDTVTLHYKASVRPGYEKLAEVLNVKVKLLSGGEIIYDVLMKDMPKSVTYKLTSAKDTTDELYYEITAYLKTSVGNEYQNKELIADFSWWAEETGNLNPSPETGDAFNVLLWASLVAISGCVFAFLLFIRRREEGE